MEFHLKEAEKIEIVTLVDNYLDIFLKELKNISPDIVVPTHCTGWKAMNQFSQEMPEQFVLNSVGTRIILKGNVR